jgi:hypothetical protein
VMNAMPSKSQSVTRKTEANLRAAITLGPELSAAWNEYELVILKKHAKSPELLFNSIIAAQTPILTGPQTAKAAEDYDSQVAFSSLNYLNGYAGVYVVTGIHPTVAVDEFSIVLYRFIHVTKELALKPIKGFAKTFKIPFSVVEGKLVLKSLSKAERNSLIDLLKERMALYNVGVFIGLVERLLDPTQLTSYKNWWVCLNFGELMNSNGKLLGSL